jgi:hypothetical protein
MLDVQTTKSDPGPTAYTYYNATNVGTKPECTGKYSLSRKWHFRDSIFKIWGGACPQTPLDVTRHLPAPLTFRTAPTPLERVRYHDGQHEKL